MEEPVTRAWVVYMLRCADGSLYTGITTDLPRRCRQHNKGTASRYTRTRRPVVLVYQETADNRSQALKREALKEVRRRAFVGCTFQEFGDSDDGNDQLAASEGVEECSGGADPPGTGLSLESNEKGCVEQGWTVHGLRCASPRPLPSDTRTHSIKSSAVSIGPARSISARITSDLGTLR